MCMCVFRCTRCTDSEYPCKWCIKHHICTNHATSAEACEDDIMVTGRHVCMVMFIDNCFLNVIENLFMSVSWCQRAKALAFEGQNKGSNALSLRNWVMSEERMRPFGDFLIWVSGLNFHHCFKNGISGYGIFCYVLD